jgi:hypothetical protein
MIKKVRQILILACIGFYLSGCTAVTRFEVYELLPVDNDHVSLRTEDIVATLYLDTTDIRKLYVPLIYQKETQKEPYRVMITIEGDLTDIEIVGASIKINSGVKNVEVFMNRDDFEYKPLSDGTPYFYLKTDKYLDYPWKDIKEVEVVFDFFGIKDGQKTKYQARKIFKPHFESELTNDAMSV